jgi:spore cortex biosynthesis protein YabQ
LFAVSDQLRMFLATVLTGVILAAAFDWHRAWRAVLRPRGWRGHLLDACFVPVGACIVAGGLLAANWGDLRAYALGGLALGAWAYARLASPVVQPVEQASIRGTLAAGRAAVRLALWPYRLGRRTAGGLRRAGLGAAGAARRLAGWAKSRLPRRPTPPPS